MKDRSLRKAIYIIFCVIGFILLGKLGQFNGLSYAFGMISVYVLRWCNYG